MMGLIFKSDRYAFYDTMSKKFDLPAIIRLLTEKGIALNDTARTVRRLKGNASDKYLEIVEPVPLHDLLDQIPDCHCVATTGEKAASVVASLTATEIPKMGEMVKSTGGLDIWRMPSTSRAYPLKLEKKAEYYAYMFRKEGII